MTKSELYLLDATGCLVKRGFANADQVARMNGALDAALRGRSPAKFRNVLNLDPVFMDFLSHPWILETCEKLLTPFFRFDHAALRQQPSVSGDLENLHGGPVVDERLALYGQLAGQIFCTQLAVGLALTPQGGHLGGFTFLPGSHKSSFPLRGSEVWRDYFPHLNEEGLQCPSLAPGDLLVMPECLVHGSTKWRGKHVRRVLYYFYVPGNLTWGPAEDSTAYSALARNETERRLFCPPFSGRFSYDDARPGNEMRTPTIPDRTAAGK